MVKRIFIIIITLLTLAGCRVGLVGENDGQAGVEGSAGRETELVPAGDSREETTPAPEAGGPLEITTPVPSPAGSLLPQDTDSAAAPPAVKLPALIAAPEPAEYPLLGVPFLSQAPFGDWQDPRQQDGCEEASVIMAMAWARGRTFNREDGLEKIFVLAAFQEENYGTYHDTSVADTIERLFFGYYDYPGASIREDITIADIKDELRRGRLIIVPADGQALGNPHFTAPGPERHMLVIKGYAPDKREFITNDPGTRNGESYRYAEAVLYNAVRDYPTGDHEPITAARKNMIVVEKL